MKTYRNALAVAVLTLASSTAFAGSSPQTDDFVVSITLQNDCTITLNDINHGTVTTLTTNNDAVSAGDNITCSFADAYSIGFNVGTGGGTYATRTLANGTNSLNFNVYSDAARTVVWGDGSGGSAAKTGTSTGGNVADPLTVYSRVFGPQTGKPEGTYSSTITATATF
jgi:spore coat protein U-like protein